MPERPTVYRPRSKSRALKTRPDATERGYDHRWRAARLAHLADHPLCVRCAVRGLVTEATVVDHKTPHRGDPALFWNTNNWQSLCAICHNRKTATEDRKAN